MKVLVTGATGFFGRGIVRRLRAEGYDVVGASRRVRAPCDISLDVADAAACRDVLRCGRYDAVVHAAALAHIRPGLVDEEACRAVNARGVRNVAEAASAWGVTRFVFISSVMVYGDFDLATPVTEEHPLKASDIYGASKIEGEKACLALSDKMRVWVLRMASMYSPDWLFNVRKRVAPPLIGRYLYFTLDPNTPRYSLCSQRNGSEAVAWAVTGRLPADVYNVADADPYRQADILAAVEHTEGEKPQLPVPKLLPSAALRMVRLLVPIHSWQVRARSRYWKFCEHNVYSTEKLQSFGLRAPPDLLSLREIGEHR